MERKDVAILGASESLDRYLTGVHTHQISACIIRDIRLVFILYSQGHFDIIVLLSYTAVSFFTSILNKEGLEAPFMFKGVNIPEG